MSIITCCLNDRDNIDRCIQSVLGLDYPDVEYLVQDGGSTDGTVEIIKTYGRRVSVVSEPDNGTLSALIQGAKRATGDYVGVCWSDDELLPEAGSWAIKAFQENPGVDIIYGDQTMVFDNDGEREVSTQGEPWSLEKFILHRSFPIFSSSFYRRQSLVDLEHKLTIEDHDEYEFWWRLGMANTIAYVPGEVSRFHVHARTRWLHPQHMVKLVPGIMRAIDDICRDPDTPRKYRRMRRKAKSATYLWLARHITSCCGDTRSAVVRLLWSLRYGVPPLKDLYLAAGQIWCSAMARGECRSLLRRLCGLGRSCAPDGRG